MRQARLARLRRAKTALAGSLVSMPGHQSLYLTDKVRGKTRTLHIPLDRLDEAKAWNREFRGLKQALQELCEIQRALLCAEIQAARR